MEKSISKIIEEIIEDLNVKLSGTSYRLSVNGSRNDYEIRLFENDYFISFVSFDVEKVSVICGNLAEVNLEIFTSVVLIITESLIIAGKVSPITILESSMPKIISPSKIPTTISITGTFQNENVDNAYFIIQNYEVEASMYVEDINKSTSLEDIKKLIDAEQDKESMIIIFIPLNLKIFEKAKSILDNIILSSTIPPRPPYIEVPEIQPIVASITLRPLTKYIPLHTYDFGSVRQENSFNTNFVAMETSDPTTSMFLNLSMHGEFTRRPQNQTIVGDFILNKISIGPPGQCTRSSATTGQYVVYALCDAVQTGSIVDVPTILREGFAHLNVLVTNSNPTIVFENTLPMKDIIYNNELTKPPSKTSVRYTGKMDEINTLGNTFFEKSYNVDTTEKYGVFLCKDWVEIEGVAMDNLLANPLFIKFMNQKYDPDNVWKNNYHRNYYYGKSKQLCKMNPEYSGNDPFTMDEVSCIQRFVSSDLFEFCQKYGRTKLSLVDCSCSIFQNGSDTVNEFKRLSLHPGSAKGTRNRKKVKGKGKHKKHSKKYKT
jgi:hypothetical protein